MNISFFSFLLYSAKFVTFGILDHVNKFRGGFWPYTQGKNVIPKNFQIPQYGLLFR